MESGQPFEYTLNMEKIFQGTFLELKSYYCREDFELVLDEYDKAPEDAKKFRTRDLARLCDARGIDVKYLLENRDSVLESISDRKAIQNQLLESFHEMYANSPSENCSQTGSGIFIRYCENGYPEEVRYRRRQKL